MIFASGVEMKAMRLCLCDEDSMTNSSYGSENTSENPKAALQSQEAINIEADELWPLIQRCVLSSRGFRHFGG